MAGMNNVSVSKGIYNCAKNFNIPVVIATCITHL